MFAKLVPTLDKGQQITAVVTVLLVQTLETPLPQNHTIIIWAYLHHLDPERKGDTLCLREQTNLPSSDMDNLNHLTLIHMFRAEHILAVRMITRSQEMEDILENVDME